jgi:hypothetical protein
MELSDGEGSTNAYISTYIMKDDSLKSTIRNVSTFAMVFSDTGGFMTITFLVAVIIVERLKSVIYYTTLIKSFYKYQSTDEKRTEMDSSSTTTTHASLHALDKNDNKKNVVEASGIDIELSGLSLVDLKTKAARVITKQVKDRKKFNYTLCTVVCDYIRVPCICRRSKEQQRMRDLYKKALLKIDDELDIRHINNELRTLKFIANILLNKHQRQMIPYFKEHVLHQDRY